ncbi:MAG: serine/threonine protein kinase [Nannocystaceae bacterium]|nr:serine/threonine protein kinase [Nannocystaceae bacterium]
MRSQPQDGPIVGRYREFEILEEIGSGSFARVYKVRAPGHRRPLALKLATDTRLAEDVIKRALREVAVLRSLTNPHVVRLHGSSVGSDHFYVLMDYLEGLPLGEFHDFDEPMQAGEALKIVLQVAMGLAEAHAQGVVHRDLKPENIWVTPDGTVKVLDFGLARAWGVPWAFGTNATAARTVVGTPHYCQPEQLLTDQLTPASDIYSLATILYEMLSGHAVLFEHYRVSEVVEALQESPLAWLDAHATRGMQPIGRYPGCAGLPNSLLELLRESLDPEPTKRPQDAGVFASRVAEILHDDLEAVAAGEVTIVGPSGPPQCHMLLPGRRTLGRRLDADITVLAPEMADTHVLLDWSGSPRPVQVRAYDGAELTYNGDPARGVITAEPGDVFGVGALSFVVATPNEA